MGRILDTLRHYRGSPLARLTQHIRLTSFAQISISPKLRIRSEHKQNSFIQILNIISKIFAEKIVAG